MSEKRPVCVVLRQVPVSSLRNAEALRMSVGLTLAENDVTIVFVGNGVYTLLPIEPERLGAPEVDKHMETLGALGCRIVAEAEALEERGIKELAWSAERLPRAEVARLLEEAGAVITY